MATKDYSKIIERSQELLKFDFPRIIEIQTQTICNGMCLVCPYKDIKKQNIRMSEKLLNKILTEIIENKTKVERVIPYLNNEPSLDSRIIPILKKLKSESIFIELSTNISNFSFQELDEILSQKLIDDFRISFFADKKETYEYLMPGLSFEQNKEKVKYLLTQNLKKENKVDIQLNVVLLPTLNIKEISKGLKRIFNNPEVHYFGFLDRCGSVKNFSNDKIYNDIYKICGCSLNRPFERMCIQANGNVILCSQDWNEEVILGNLNESSIYDIWNSSKFKNIRETVLGKVNKDILCNRCKLAIIKDKHMILNFAGDKYMDENDTKNLEGGA